MKSTILALMIFTSAWASAADFPTGTFSCKKFYNGNRLERTETIKISEIKFPTSSGSALSLPLIESEEVYADSAQEFKNNKFKGIANVSVSVRGEVYMNITPNFNISFYNGKMSVYDNTCTKIN